MGLTHALGGLTRPLGGPRNQITMRSILRSRTGIWYDPQDLATMYQDAAGTLPVYRPGTGQVDPPVGLMMDKGGGGYHASQTTTTARPTLSGRYNLLTATETLSTQSVTTAATNYTLKFEGTGTITLSGTAAGTYSAGTHTITCTAGALTCTVAGTVTKADLRVKRDGSSLPAYQAVTNANTYDTAGFPLFLKRDKVDDDLIVQAPAITGAWAHGTIDGPVIGTVAIPAGEYHPFGVSLGSGLPDCTQWVAINGPLSASEQDIFERYVYSKARQLIGVDQFGASNFFNTFYHSRTDITSIDSSRWDTSILSSLNQTFFNATKLQSIDVSGWDTSNVKSFHYAFYNCSALQALDVSNWDVGKATYFVETFLNCKLLTVLDVSGWDTKAVVSFGNIFKGCSGITSLDISGWDTTKVISTEGIGGFNGFAEGCASLEDVIVGNAFDNTPCTSFRNAFVGANLNQASIDAILVSINNAGTSNGTFNQSGGSAPSATGEAAITAMRSRGWTVTVTGGF